MLTDSNNIYKMCPIYNQIISREAQIGDYILTYNSVGVVIDEYYDKFDDGEEFCYIKFHNLLTSYNLSPIQYRDYSCSLRKNNKEYVVITKELFDIIINNISDIEFKKIYDIVHIKNEDDDDISPITSSSQKTASKVSKPSHSNQLSWNDKPELSKIDSNSSAKQKDASDTTEMMSILSKQNSFISKEPQSQEAAQGKVLPAKETSMKQRKKGLEMRSKNLLVLARAEDPEQEKSSSILKLDKIPSNESQSNYPVSLSPIVRGHEATSRQNFQQQEDQSQITVEPGLQRKKL